MSLISNGNSLDRDLSRNVERGPYILRDVLSKDQLSENGLSNSVCVTCVEFWDANLYVGTSAAEILHYVRISPSDDDVDEWASFTYATTLPVPFVDKGVEHAAQVSGVQQILILSQAGKACILCNGSINFYSLPELSPVFASNKLTNCTWVGGVDQDAKVEENGSSAPENITVMICQKSRIRLVTVGERTQRVREIELGGCLDVVRRGAIACVADATSYSLVDVVGQQWIPLFDISSIKNLDVSGTETENKPTDPISFPAGDTRTVVKSSSDDTSLRTSPDRPQGRDPSTGVSRLEAESLSRLPSSERPLSQDFGAEIVKDPTRTSSITTGMQPAELPRQNSPRGNELDHRPKRESASGFDEELPMQMTSSAMERLRPHIISPTPNEFLLTTGTSHGEPAVGMFVNMEGEIPRDSRGTMEFSHYPEALCSDRSGVNITPVDHVDNAVNEGFVLALIDQERKEEHAKTIEIKRWDLDPTEPGGETHWLNVPCKSWSKTNRFPRYGNTGLRRTASTCETRVDEITKTLGLSRLRTSLPSPQDQHWTSDDRTADFQDQERAEAKFIGRLSKATASMLVWAHNSIYWVVCNPMILKLDASLMDAMENPGQDGDGLINHHLIEQTLSEIRGREPVTELESLTLSYIRQKGSIALFIDMMHTSVGNKGTSDHDRQATEEALSEAELDPRVLLLLLPRFRGEIIEGANGIRVPNGLKALIQGSWLTLDSYPQMDEFGPAGDSILQLVKRFLIGWRRKKGFGSIVDEKEVFETVDAALLHILLVLDTRSPPGFAKRGSLRSELNGLVDNGVDCFERAIKLLEQYKRLYVLSRLYQSRKMSRYVLATWKRIIEGEEDPGGEFTNGESEVRKYLANINDPMLVEEYGSWLASRNPKLGVRVFSETGSKIRFTPEKAIEILKRKAPNAVKEYLEKLVFEHNLAGYANDLIGYYLDSVLSELAQSSDSRLEILSSYDLYRSLPSPKPTYNQFAADYALDAEWWRNRLRLLQLLGGNHEAASQYDIDLIFARIEAFKEELVPEMIILNGRQGRHREAMRLLTHALGDFDTAISYCVRGGLSTYSSVTGSQLKESGPTREQQESLLNQLVEEFLNIEDLSDRVTQTSQLLERFAAWFDVKQVLTLIPDSWSVKLLSSFLENAFRSIVAERHEASITRALTSNDNLVANFELVKGGEWTKARVQQVG